MNDNIGSLTIKVDKTSELAKIENTLMRLGDIFSDKESMKLSPEDQYHNSKIYIYPHSRADGDAYGSAFALQLLLKKLNVAATVVLSEEISAPFDRYINEIKSCQYVIYKQNNKKEIKETILNSQQIAILIDCNELSRLAERAELINKDHGLIIIDHHIENSLTECEISKRLAQEQQVCKLLQINTARSDYSFKYINPAASAICQDLALLFFFLERSYKQDLYDEDIAKLLYCGMLTDSNRFTYSAVNEITLFVASKLKEEGVNQESLIRDLFETRTLSSIRAEALIINNLMSFNKSMLNISFLTRQEILEHSIADDDLAFAPSFLREIEGCKIAIFLRETEKGNIRGNVRSIEPFSARQIANFYDGGGHECAAGFSIMNKNLSEILEEVIDRSNEILKEQIDKQVELRNA